MKHILKKIKYITKVKISIFILALLLVIFSVLFYNRILNTTIDEAKVELKEIGNNNAIAVSATFERYEKYLELAADIIGENTATLNVEEALSTAVDDENFEDTRFYSLEELMFGTSINGNELPSALYENYNNGESFVTNVFYDETLKENVVGVVVPIIDEGGQILGFLMGILTVEELSNRFNDIFYTYDGYFHVIDQNGRYVAVSDAQNMIGMDVPFAEAASVLSYEENFSYEKMASDFIIGNADYTEYASDNGESRVVYYSPISTSKWIMYTVADKAALNADAYAIILNSLIYIVIYLLIFIALGMVVLNVRKKSDELTDEYESRFSIVSKQLRKYFFEYDDDYRLITFLGDRTHKFSTSNEIEIDGEEFNDFVHNDENLKFLDYLENIRAGKVASNIKLRLKDKDEGHIWYSLSLFPIKDNRTKNYHKAVGFLENIDVMMKETIQLKEMSETDLLTDLYNKITTEKLIEHTLLNSNIAIDHHALIIVDVDNFKTLNDTFGHQYGDKVIKELANSLSILFRGDDIVGRLGGDEFIILMKNVTDIDALKNKVSQINTKLKREYKKGNITVNISSSIGVAMYPNNGYNFKTLYLNADTALYKAKDNGKDRHEYYDLSNVKINLES